MNIPYRFIHSDLCTQSDAYSASSITRAHWANILDHFLLLDFPQSCGKNNVFEVVDYCLQSNALQFEVKESTTMGCSVL